MKRRVWRTYSRCIMVGSSLALQKPVQELHKPFLNLVKDQGEGEIILSVEEGIAEIELSNPKKRNAMSGRMMANLAAIVDTIVPCEGLESAYRDLVGLVITGKGSDAFCSGADFKLVKTLVNTPERGVMMSRFMTDCLERIRQASFISICHINGPALGGGAELCTTCDFRTMRDGAAIQFVHARIGAAPGWGGARRLTHIVGRKVAIHAIAGSQKIDLENALDYGLVDMGVSDKEGSKQLLSMFTSDQLYGESVRCIKKSISGVEHLSDQAAKDLELEMFRQRWYSADNQTALARK